MLSSLKDLRVHIAPIGFETRRVVDPLVGMHADKVYLIQFKPDDSAKDYYKKVKLELTRYGQIEVREEFVDMWNLYDCIGKFRQIIRDERGNHIYINVSTGTKITAMAGMLSCMLWKGSAEPYYARSTEYKVIEGPTTRVDRIESLPVYGINGPKSEWLVVLKIIMRNSKRIRKSKLLKALEEQGIIKQKEDSVAPGVTREFTLAAKYSQLRVILDSMIFWKYVQVEGSGRRSEVIVTQQGEDALRIFGEPEK
jgi:hypothetical protein